MRGVSLAFCLLTALVLPSPARAQQPRVPAATVQRVISSEFAFCGRTETASAAELDRIGAEIQQAIDLAQRRVNQLAADSAAVSTALKNAQAKVDEVDGKLSPLQVERAKVLSDMTPYADQIARLEQGNAPAGAVSEHAELMAREAELRKRVADLTAQLEKLRNVQRTGPMNPLPTSGDDIQRFFQGMASADGPVADLRKAQNDLAAVMGRLREIRRETIPIRFSPEYTALQRRLEELNRQIGDLETQLQTAQRARDTAKSAWESFDVKALAVAHEENLYVYEHMTRAQHCVQKRREQLNREAPPVATTTAGAVSGQWGVFCRFTDPDYGELTDGGTFRLTFDGRGGVAGSYVSSNATYTVAGTVAADGSAAGSGSGSGWAVTWSGRFGQSGGGTVGNGSVAVNITQYGGGTCSGTWSAP